MTGRERLTAAAAAIMACPLPESNFVRLNIQRQTSLVVAGHKPASEIHLFGPDATSADRASKVTEAERRALEAWMDRVGLHWHIMKDDAIKRGSGGKPWSRRLSYATALDVIALRRMDDLWRNGTYPTDAVEHGRLSGFPETAIRAMTSDGEVFTADTLPRELTDEPVMATVQFRFSVAHWREELAIVRPWVDEVRDVLPELYAELERLNNADYRQP